MRSPTNAQFDELIDGLPGFFYSGAYEPDAYPVYIGVFDYGTGHDPDAAQMVHDRVLGYVGEDVQVLVDDESATVTPAVDGVSLRRMTNTHGVVGLELSLTVRVPQQYGGSPAAGTRFTAILIDRADGQLVEIHHQPLQYSQYGGDQLAAAIESIFTTLSLPK